MDDEHLRASAEEERGEGGEEHRGRVVERLRDAQTERKEKEQKEILFCVKEENATAR